MEFLALQVQMAQMVRKAQQELMEETARLDRRGLLVQLALLVQMDHQERQGPQEQLAHKDLQVQTVQQVLLAQRAIKENVVLQVKMQLSTRLNLISERSPAISVHVIKI
jgi:hypothetical protein